MVTFPIIFKVVIYEFENRKYLKKSHHKLTQLEKSGVTEIDSESNFLEIKG